MLPIRKMIKPLVLALGLLLALALAPQVALAQSANALLGWQCKTSQPVGWCAASTTNPLPVVTTPSSTTVGFTPAAASSGTIAVTAVSANLNVPGTGAQIYVANVGTKEAFIKFGTDNTVAAVAGGATTALTGDMSVPSGLAVVFNIGTNTWIAAIAAAGDTTTLRVTRGVGQ